MYVSVVLGLSEGGTYSGGQREASGCCPSDEVGGEDDLRRFGDEVLDPHRCRGPHQKTRKLWATLREGVVAVRVLQNENGRETSLTKQNRGTVRRRSRPGRRCLLLGMASERGKGEEA